jgi:hypothetical protein
MYTVTVRHRDLTDAVLLERNRKLREERDTLHRLWQMGLKEIAVLRQVLKQQTGIVNVQGVIK